MTPAKQAQAQAQARPQPPLAEADDWALFLDVDGTLLELVDDPAAVQVPAELPCTLAALHAALGGALALVSGRGIDFIDGLFGHPGWPVAGLHGLEWRGGDGRRHAAPLDAGRWQALREGAAALATRLPGIRLEEKPPCLALHCREAPQHAAAMARGAAELAAHLPGYEVQAGNHIQELKPAGQDKGAAVRRLMGEPPFRGRRPVYCGDDLTDEYAFAAVNAAGGISVRVGNRTPSAALFTLHNVAAVHAWLCSCARAARQDRS
ncbi:MAG TPA: trehalose-phosphatase [Rhodanobacteraceae bacterium]|nr:trehalose-phosphatase [Rhodanobacteraceae bacterium]